MHFSWSVNYDITYQTIHGSADSFYNETWKLWHHRHMLHNLRSQPSRPLWYENVHRNYVGTVGHCDVTIASGQQLFTFWNRIVPGSSGGIKCGFTQVRRQKSHKWLAHRIPRPSIVWYALCKERQASWFQRRWRILFAIIDNYWNRSDCTGACSLGRERCVTGDFPAQKARCILQCSYDIL